MKSKFHLPKAPLMILGAFFFCIIGVSCQEKTTPAWSQAATTTKVATSNTDKAAATRETTKRKPDAGKSAPDKTRPEAEPGKAGGKSVRFLAYNLENYLTMDRTVDGERIPRPKPEKEKKALVEIITSQKPDILGICEVGTEEDLLDLQTRLKKNGLDLPYHEYAHGWDNTRRLGLLSALPIKERNSESELFYPLAGSNMQFSRGILDVTIALPGGNTHFVGLHLKSKRELPRYDQELMRQNEALLARKHCDKIFEDNPKARVIAYGDLNDTRHTPTVSNLRGQWNAKEHLEDIPLTDSRGELWTYFWDYQDVYSRFDYILLSGALEKAYDPEKSCIVDPENWDGGSDHRALLLVIEK